MGCLQIPRLIIAVERLERSMRSDYDRRASVESGVKVLDDDGAEESINTLSSNP